MPALSHLHILAAVSSLSGAQFGFDTAIISGALVSIHSDLRSSSPTDVTVPSGTINGTAIASPSASIASGRRPLTAGEQELIVSITTAGAILGALAASFISRFWGRRTITMISSILFALGSIEQAASQYVRELVLGRAIVGVAIGLASMITPTYLSEVCPAEVRGKLVSLNIVFVTVGQVIAYVVSAAMFHLPHSWRWMILVGVLPAIIQLVGVIYLDESPRWLVSRGRDREARQVLQRIYPFWSGSHIDAEIENIRNSAGAEASDAGSTPALTSSARSKQRRGELMTLFRDRSSRKALVLACGLQLFQQLCGFNALCYFGASILRMTGFRSNPVLAALPISIANCVGTIVAMRLVDRPNFGRRKLLLWTTAFAAIWLALLGAALLGVKNLGDVVEHAHTPNRDDLKPEPTSVFEVVRRADGVARSLGTPTATLAPGMVTALAVAMNETASTLGKSTGPSYPAPSGWSIVSLICMIVFTLSYALGLGVIPWIVQAEALGADVRLRAVGGALATASNWTANLCVSAVFLDLVRVISLPGSFWLYSGITTLAWLFAWWNLPEMSGLDIDQTARMFDGPSSSGASSGPYRRVRARDVDDEDEEDGRSLLPESRVRPGKAGLAGVRKGGGGGDEEIWRVRDSEDEEDDDDDDGLEDADIRGARELGASGSRGVRDEDEVPSQSQASTRP